MKGLALAALLAASASAQPKLAIEHYRLPNGLNVIFHVDRKTPLVHLNLRYYVGSRHERPGRYGFAHLFEHVMYDSVEPPPNYAVALERLGASNFNGSTSTDYTSYYETVPSGRLERLLWMESGRLASLLDGLSQAVFDKEREVVRNELRQRVENDIYKRVVLPLYQYTFPLGHPYQHSVIGSHEDLQAATLDDVRAFYREHYTVDNLTIAMAGDFDPAQAKQWIAKYFGTLSPGQSGVISPERSAPLMTEAKLVEFTDHVPDEHTLFARPSPGEATPDAAALDIAEFILSNAEGYLKTCVKADICRWTSIEQIHLRDAGIFIVGSSPAEGKMLDDVDRSLSAAMAKFGREGPTKEEVASAKDNLNFQQLGKLENLYDLANTLNHVQQYYVGVEHFQDWATRYDKVTPESVADAVRRWLVTPNRLAIHVTPETAERSSSAEPDRKQPPPFQPEKSYRFPEVRTAKLPNGLTVFGVERHELSKVAVDFRLRLGPEQNPSGKPGVELMAISAASFGTKTRTKEQIESETRQLATAFHGDSTGESQSGGFEVLRKNLDSAFAIFADVIRNPVYPESNFEDQKKDFVKDYEDAVGRLNNYEFPMMKIMFGANHPLGSMMGTAESRKALTRKDAQDFHDRYWKPDIASLAFAGDITLEEATAIANKYLGDWTGSAPPAPPMPAPQPISGRLFLIDRPDATQTNIVAMLPSVPRDHPDYVPLLVANRVWGGLSSSRLFSDIRIQQAISYGMGSEVLTMSAAGVWLSRGMVQIDKTSEAVAEIIAQLRDFTGPKPITAQELATAKDSLLLLYPGGFEQVSDVVKRLTSDWAVNLPTSYIQGFADSVATLSLDQVNSVARKYAITDRMKFLLIGDRRKIEPGLKSLGLGAVTVLP